jgi:hypothetical protein
VNVTISFSDKPNDLSVTEPKTGATRVGGLLVSRRMLAATAASITLSAVALGGCGLSTLTSGLGGLGGGSKPAADAGKAGISEEKMLTAAKVSGTDSGVSDVGEVAAGCPKFIVWSRDNSLTIYETGRVGDGLAVMHRGEITQTARECEVEPGKVTVKYGFSGRVLLGPRGKTGKVTLPLTVFVTDAKRERVSTEKMKVDVAVAVEQPIGYFSFVKSVTFPVPVGARPGEFELFVGFEKNVPGAG